ncbi:hypothetical protein EON66_09030 [archaeon]|nr:MAG: hypothetical protein EON66_09030 [archaeon]
MHNSSIFRPPSCARMRMATTCAPVVSDSTLAAGEGMHHDVDGLQNFPRSACDTPVDVAAPRLDAKSPSSPAFLVPGGSNSTHVDWWKPLGCFHGSELVNVFDFTSLLWGDGEMELADAFVRYWTNFAVSGNPNGNGLPTWKAYGEPGGPFIAQIDTSKSGPTLTHLKSFQSAQCAFWSNVTIPDATLWGAV